MSRELLYHTFRAIILALLFTSPLHPIQTQVEYPLQSPIPCVQLLAETARRHPHPRLDPDALVDLTATLSLGDVPGGAPSSTAPQRVVNTDYDTPPADGKAYEKQLAEKKRVSCRGM